MEKKGVDTLLNSKEAKVSILLFVSIVAVFIFTFMMSTIFVSGISINVTSPLNFTFSTSSNNNFTFNSTWQLGDDDPIPHENVSNCSFWLSGPSTPWDIYRNATTGGADIQEDANLSNGSISYLNYTFTDSGNYTYAIACYPFNNTVDGVTYPPLNFSANNIAFFLQIKL